MKKEGRQLSSGHSKNPLKEKKITPIVYRGLSSFWFLYIDKAGNFSDNTTDPIGNFTCVLLP